jgi:hypothetical protein
MTRDDLPSQLKDENLRVVSFIGRGVFAEFVPRKKRHKKLCRFLKTWSLLLWRMPLR